MFERITAPVFVEVYRVNYVHPNSVASSRLWNSGPPSLFCSLK
jgi:hypothetical protein